MQVLPVLYKATHDILFIIWKMLFLNIAYNWRNIGHKWKRLQRVRYRNGEKIDRW